MAYMTWLFEGECFPKFWFAKSSISSQFNHVKQTNRCGRRYDWVFLGLPSNVVLGLQYLLEYPCLHDEQMAHAFSRVLINGEFLFYIDLWC